MNKRILSLVLALVMVLGTFGTVFAAATTPTGNEKVDKLIELALVKGYADGTYGLDQAITRAEVATMVVRALDLETVANASMAFPSQFTDMNSANVLWARGYVNVAAGQGIVNGYPEDGSFKPAGNITYAEGAKMLVEVLGGLTEAEKANAVWPTTYLAKAAQLGIFANVDGIVDYNAPAIRESLFEMVFNTLMAGTDLLIASTVEGIVVENYRTETLAKDEVVVHVMKDQVARSSATYEDSKYFEESDEFKVVITPELAEKGLDVETLLGKVVKVSFDKDNKVVGIEQLPGYTYVSGNLKAITAKTIEVAGKKYTVEKTESRAAADERLYQVYENNDDIAYNELDAEYANVTVRNGKVLFIDAFNFEDVAPVAKDIDSKNKVAYYDDASNGEIRTLTVDEKSYVINFVDGVMQLGNYEDISANDVIHFFGKTVIVRPAEDNMVEGEFEEVNAARASAAQDINIVVDGEDYPAELKEEKRDPVYSVTSSSLEFETLTENYDVDLKPFEDTEVVLLLDMFGNVQLISSDKVDSSFYAMVIQVLNNEFRLLKADNVKDYYTTNIRHTEFLIQTDNGETEEAKKSMFEVTSLVRATANEDVLTEVTLIPEDAYAVENFTKNLIKIAGIAPVYTNNKTIVFVENGKDSKAMTVDAFLTDYVTKDADGKFVDYLEAYVALNAKDDKVADAIVIIGAKTKSAATNTIVAKVSRVSVSGSTYYLRLQQADGTLSTHKVVTGEVYKVTTDPVITKGDIIEVKVTKDDAANITLITPYEELDVDAATYKVLSKSAGVIELETLGELRIARGANVFGDYNRGDFVSIVQDADGLVTIIDVREENTDVTTKTNVIDAITVVGGKTIITIDNVLYEFAGTEADLAEGVDVGVEVTYSIQTLNGVEFIYNIKPVVK